MLHHLSVGFPHTCPSQPWRQVSLCSAFVFLVTSMWLATRAAVAAGSFNVRLQTQYIRLPLPDDEQLDSALTKAEDFEGVELTNILRLPFLTGLWHKFWGNKIAGQGEKCVGDLHWNFIGIGMGMVL